VAATAGTVLLAGWHMHALLSDIPRERVAAYPPQTLPPLPAGQPGEKPAASALVTQFPAAPAPTDTKTPELAQKPGSSTLLPIPPPPLQENGGPAPVHGPQWDQAPLPAFSPDLLQAMMDPRAARRARHFRRLGIVLSPEPQANPQRPVSPAAPARPDPGKAGRTVTSSGAKAAATPADGHRAVGSATGGPAAPTSVARLDPAASTRAGHPIGTPAASPADSTKTEAAKPTGTDAGADDARPGGEGGKNGTAAATPPASGPPVRLQARLEPLRSSYRAGEWVALRFLASRPVHMRVYRVDAAGHVTRVYSTYGREEAGSPARTFSTMVKAGDPKPGPEGMIAIGSERPLTHDELLACLRAYLAEVPAPSTPAPAEGASPADALKAVIEAVDHAADAPETAASPLDRSAWSVAIGQFTSAPRPTAERQSTVPGTVSPDTAHRPTL
jgi:hypothetical protein